MRKNLPTIDKLMMRSLGSIINFVRTQAMVTTKFFFGSQRLRNNEREKKLGGRLLMMTAAMANFFFYYFRQIIIIFEIIFFCGFDGKKIKFLLVGEIVKETCC